MNAKSLSMLVLSMLLSTPALAGDRVLMEIDCSHRVRPTLQAFAASAGIDNAHQAYLQRSKAWVGAVRACHRGYGLVRVVRPTGRSEPRLQLVRR